MKIELFYFDGCPSYEAFLPRLRGLLAQAGVDAPVKQRRMESDVDAQQERFLGSPTVRVDGVDVDSGAADRIDFGVKCRLYPTAQGLQGTPPDSWVLDGLQRAAGGTNAS